jgi:hypothetical protein
MNEPLHPSSLGEILDRTFQIYRSKFLVFVVIATVPALAMRGIHLAADPWFHGPSTIYLTRRGITLWNFAVSLGFYHIASFMGLLVLPVLVHLASTVSFGYRSSFSTALHFFLDRWRSYLWIAVLKVSSVLLIPEILVAMLFFGVGIIAFFTGKFGEGTVMGTASVLLILGLPLIAGGALFLWLASCLSLVVPACALEGIGGFNAFRRSWTLSKGSRARIIFAWLAIVAAVLFGGYLAHWVVYFAFSSFGSGWSCRHGFSLYTTCYSLAPAFVTALVGPVYPIAITLFYYDQRIRHEGYDIERMMEEAGMTAPSNPPSGDNPIAPAAEEPRP